MKYILALLGAVCLVGGLNAAVNINLPVLNFTIVGLNAINATNNQFVNATVIADQQVRAALTNWNNTLIANFTALAKTYQPYSSVLSISSLTSAMSNPASASISSIAMDPSLSSLNSTVFSMAQQSAAALNALAANISANAGGCSTDFSTLCANKFLTNLTAANVNISRYAACIANETVKIGYIALNMSTSINTSLATTQSMFNMTAICNLPPVAQLTPTSSGSMPPSVQCMNQFFSSFSSLPTQLNFVTSALYPQTQGISQRVQRCASLTSADISDTIANIQNAYSFCLVTGP